MRAPRLATHPLLEEVGRFFMFDHLLRSDGYAIEARRAGWPLWRRAVRPIGALAWWLGVVSNTFLASSWSTASAAYRIWSWSLTVVLVSCIGYGIVDGYRERRVERRT